MKMTQTAYESNKVENSNTKNRSVSWPTHGL